VITSTNGDPDVECANIDRLDARHVDGLIVLTNRPDDGRIPAVADPVHPRALPGHRESGKPGAP